MKHFVLTSFALASIAATSLAHAQEETTAATTETTATETTATTTAAPATTADEPKISVGGDVQFVLPLGDFGDATGPQIGALLRFGYALSPQLELTGRVGYLHGLSKDQTFIKTSVSTIPIMAGVRYFFMEPGAGAYAGAEAGVNILRSSVTTSLLGNENSASDSSTRIGFNVGAGYVISKDLPIDIRAQFMHYNLLLTESGEKAALGIGVSVGYTARF
jgi:hypothetical protein